MNPTHKSTRQATQTSHTKKIRGFTLIELMVVVVIIGIIAAIGYPAYMDQIRKSRRATAQSALSDAAARMEQFFLDNKSYADDMNKLGYGVAAGAPYPTPEGFYNVAVDAPIVGVCPLASCYALTATAINLQTDDTKCPTITLDSRGNRGPAGSGCW